MPLTYTGRDDIDYDPPALPDDKHHCLPVNVRVHDNFIQLIAVLVGGGLGAWICLRNGAPMEWAFAGAAVGVTVAMLTASAVIRFIRR